MMYVDLSGVDSILPSPKSECHVPFTGPCLPIAIEIYETNLTNMIRKTLHMISKVNPTLLPQELPVQWHTLYYGLLILALPS